MGVTTKSPRLADFMCFAIYSANLAYGKAYKPILEPKGVTYTQYIVLVALSEEDHQTVGSLGEKLFLESNTLTPILKKLESLGYVTRQRDPKDERQVVISLTDAGRALREQALEMDLVAATGLSLDELKTMQRGVAALRDNLRKHVQEGAATPE
ncbi:MarR family transcriptional regulator [Mycolicibacterium wolinskyi]|uniref:MarR family transcriptional regulator n=1 Tax=Mycolicibacterium wolinskyi TaxID=59750 RepID=A0A1X2F1S1_9MYCO|nr:MarR family transcriptional regulator [Mycolicibacterium wolinskyi]MCV7294775.1 MarR family transcriptional regulator [Mycolicibacterium goodii]ORX12372.1 MarR family transcriptional regulator [Mycolicibacterium wolinskyi]